MKFYLKAKNGKNVSKIKMRNHLEDKVERMFENKERETRIDEIMNL